jgi:uncharacterized delta-60 repeat protein
MSFSISNTSAAAVITKLSTPSSVTGELTITEGSLPLVQGDLISGTNTEINNTKGSPYGSIQMFLQQGDAKIDTYVNNTLYSTDNYSSGLISVQTPILESSDSLTMSVSDPSFDCYSIGAWGGDIPEQITQQSDGKMIYVGYFTSYAGVAANRIIRLNTDFSIDDTFVYGTGFNGETNAVAIQPDGKILVGGNFTQYNGTARNRIVRLNTDGSLDTTFNIGTGFNASVWAITIQPDNKILVGGQFTSYSGDLRAGVIRLTSTGAIDTTFANLSPLNNTVYQVALQSDNKVVIGGIFSSVSGLTCGGIARLSSTGIVDNTFQLSGFTTGSAQGVYGLSVDPSGKIICVGTFNTYSGASVGGDIARLNTDGTYDSTFVVGSGITGSGRFALDVTPTNGKYLITGVFDNYNGSSVGSIMRLNSDGSLDTTFNTGTGTGYDVNAFGAPSYIQSDGNYNFTSVFSDYDGTPTTNMIVLDPMGKLLNCD